MKATLIASTVLLTILLGCEHDSDDAIGVDRDAYGLDLSDGRRIEAWVVDEGVLAAELIDPQGEAILDARWELDVGISLNPSEASVTLVDALIGVPKSPTAAAFAHWLATDDLAPTWESSRTTGEIDEFTAVSVPSTALATSVHEGYLAWPTTALNTYDFTCSAGTSRAWAFIDNIPDRSDGIIQLALNRPGLAVALTSAAQWVVSPRIQRNDGAGAYRVRVHKLDDLGGADLYRVRVGCENAAGDAVQKSPMQVSISGNVAVGYTNTDLVDVYDFDCPAGTVHAQARIGSLGPNSIRLKLKKSGGAEVALTDAADGQISEWLNTAAAGAGTYRATVNQVWAGNVAFAEYDLRVRCQGPGVNVTLPATLNLAKDNGVL